MIIDHTYYGRLSDEPLKGNDLADNACDQIKDYMKELIQDMQESIKRHMTECKREIIKKIEKKEDPFDSEKALDANE